MPCLVMLQHILTAILKGFLDSIKGIGESIDAAL